jgi:hypothetical protein
LQIMKLFRELVQILDSHCSFLPCWPRVTTQVCNMLKGFEGRTIAATENALSMR